MSSQHTIVVGAGIVGAASAIWLRRAGHDVTLIDKGEPGMGASYGNGCILASCSVVPVTAPGLVKKRAEISGRPEFSTFHALGIFSETVAVAGDVFKPCK